jgi:hypothetical protein
MAIVAVGTIFPLVFSVQVRFLSCMLTIVLSRFSWIEDEKQPLCVCGTRNIRWSLSKHGLHLHASLCSMCAVCDSTLAMSQCMCQGHRHIITNTEKKKGMHEQRDHFALG